MHGYGEIFDEKFHSSKYGRKEKWTNAEKNKLEEAGSKFHDITKPLSTCVSNMSILACMVVEKSLTKNFTNKKGTEGRTEGTDGRADVNQYTPTFSKRGI